MRNTVGLGDLIEGALSSAGLTAERVEGWLGRPCRCKERKEKLNALVAWAWRVARGQADRASEHLDKMVEGG